MTVAHLVIYQGAAADPEAFFRHYRDVHVPIIQTMPRIRNIDLHRGIAGDGIALVARFEFDSMEHLTAAMQSEARQRARRDAEENFADFKGAVWHQDVEIVSPAPG